MNIKEAAKATGLSNDTIRYYERIGIIMTVPRKENQLRDFTERNINQLKFAKTMRHAGVSIERLREYMGMVLEDDNRTIPARKALLLEQAEEMQGRINEIQAAYDHLLYKTDHYESHMRQAESRLE
ncbi:MerR family transcriptional regulator [Fructobacillus evanidus]|uniref:MerR family (SoxR) n=1 Tax=Fructobacillus evanidus TaxID=3064281 RepID=A0ABM9MVT6_9LACO|nr:DNA-binding transcriptional regulator [Fructobacillus sp. LMG 32999]CAK1230493.1 DNA-binding transcriptional regulator [Fructobacillus sp. LMG 32999]CAK1233256.1 DNA-binding transcriptional regulator [Fructobacillus sp. LMG 32999]CAK1233446.1 DNA-binding transcriptional regulator [Fructobacillus sp. LMG 32999]CAK1234546.1 DNA-binding transcriptional regulator [Fructobacillus sp. LMG 32999]